jgi:hypothetical protein
MPKKRLISASYTQTIKWAVPLMTLIIFGAYLSAYLSGWQGSRGDFKWAVLVCFLIALFAIWACLSLRNVCIDDQGLYVSHRGNEVLVRFSEIADVIESKSANGTITIVLINNSTVGRRIVFIPSGSRGALLTHPIASEIREKSKGSE